jgi:hypothetical protein
LGNIIENEHLHVQVLDERIIWKWVFRKWEESMDRIELALVGLAAGTCDFCIIFGEFLDKLINVYLYKKGPKTCSN